MLNNTIEKKLERFNRFWNQAPTDRPIIGMRMHTLHPLETFNGGPHFGAVTPEQLNADAFYADFERLESMYSLSIGDEIHAASAFYGVPWLEAILGCEVEVKGSSMWAKPCLHDWSNLEEIRFDSRNPWFLKLLAITEETASYFNEQIPVGLPLLRGPGDIAAAIRGNDNFCMDLILEPNNIGKLLDVCVDTYIQVTKALFEICKPWYGGFVEPIRHIWAPGYCVETQVDVSSLLSPTHYREFILPGDTRVLDTYDYIFLHIHTSSLHILDEILSIKPLSALEISVDVGGPKPIEFLDNIRKILDQTPLILQGDLSADEIVQLCELLPPEGFYILVLVNTPEEGNLLLRDVFDTL